MTCGDIVNSYEC